MRSERRHSQLWDGWRGTILITATYVYFLIFAQFGFLKRLDAIGILGDALKPVMGAMAVGGILASLGAARLNSRWAASTLRIALAGCAMASTGSLLPLNAAGAMVVSFLIGVFLGGLTVTLVAHLPLWIGNSRPLLRVALGTGLGYFICNFPPLFTANPRSIAICAAIACLCGLAASAPTSQPGERQLSNLRLTEPLPFAVILLWLTALVWLDSAAFSIIQNSPALKSGTWEGTAHLWRTGSVHLLAALFSGWLLARQGAALTLIGAFASLGTACLLLLNPSVSSWASILYPAGVSLYSVVLVAYPSLFLAGASQPERSRRAGWIYAIAGWIGSALGIGMAQHLHRIPVWFVALAGALFLLPASWRYGRRLWREGLAMALVLAAAWGIDLLVSPHTAPQAAAVFPSAGASAIEEGRRIYIAEGCINCHSQYVRPDSPDVAMWGPIGDLEAIRREKPPLIGNRRQGPDLSNVGARRSPLWFRIHLIDPRAVSYGSIMPSYSYLFLNQRGDDLLAYLKSLKHQHSAQHLQSQIVAWHPEARALAESRDLNGARLFVEYCGTCHDSAGAARKRWGAEFKVLPPNLAADSLPDLPDHEPAAELRLRLARIIKFGMPGTDMPGHEYLPDAQVQALASYFLSLRSARDKVHGSTSSYAQAKEPNRNH